MSVENKFTSNLWDSAAWHSQYCPSGLTHTVLAPRLQVPPDIHTGKDQKMCKELLQLEAGWMLDRCRMVECKVVYPCL